TTSQNPLSEVREHSLYRVRKHVEEHEFLLKEINKLELKDQLVITDLRQKQKELKDYPENKSKLILKLHDKTNELLEIIHAIKSKKLAMDIKCYQWQACRGQLNGIHEETYRKKEIAKLEAKKVSILAAHPLLMDENIENIVHKYIISPQAKGETYSLKKNKKGEVGISKDDFTSALSKSVNQSLETLSKRKQAYISLQKGDLNEKAKLLAENINYNGEQSFLPTRFAQYSVSRARGFRNKAYEDASDNYSEDHTALINEMFMFADINFIQNDPKWGAAACRLYNRNQNIQRRRKNMSIATDIAMFTVPFFLGPIGGAITGIASKATKLSKLQNSKLLSWGTGTKTAGQIAGFIATEGALGAYESTLIKDQIIKCQQLNQSIYLSPDQSEREEKYREYLNCKSEVDDMITMAIISPISGVAVSGIARYMKASKHSASAQANFHKRKARIQHEMTLSGEPFPKVKINSKGEPILKADEASKFIEAQKILGRKLNQDERVAIIQIHRIHGPKSKGCGEYSGADIFRKTRLAKAYFNASQIKELMDNCILGNKKKISKNSKTTKEKQQLKERLQNHWQKEVKLLTKDIPCVKDKSCLHQIEEVKDNLASLAVKGDKGEDLVYDIIDYLEKNDFAKKPNDITSLLLGCLKGSIKSRCNTENPAQIDLLLQVARADIKPPPHKSYLETIIYNFPKDTTSDIAQARAHLYTLNPPKGKGSITGNPKKLLVGEDGNFLEQLDNGDVISISKAKYESSIREENAVTLLKKLGHKMERI
ncbi:MAG: hypothetical protein OEW87_13535, partial [Flavobacteriaceae bacterium]|nr:hypothetical protein [Flavobacteriaceae bacterium]